MTRISVLSISISAAAGITALSIDALLLTQMITRSAFVEIATAYAIRIQNKSSWARACETSFGILTIELARLRRQLALVHICNFNRHVVTYLLSSKSSHTFNVPIQVVPPWSVLYPLLHMHLYDPKVLTHIPFLHRSGIAWHSSISENTFTITFFDFLIWFHYVYITLSIDGEAFV